MIIEKAQELGLALSESEEFRAMMDAQAAVDANAGIQALMVQYTQKRETIVSMMEQDQGDKDTLMELGRELDEIQSTLLTDPIFQAMVEAQQNFQFLMRQVNKTIAACIGMEDPDLDANQDASCTGSCATCPGCKH